MATMHKVDPAIAAQWRELGEAAAERIMARRRAAETQDQPMQAPTLPAGLLPAAAVFWADVQAFEPAPWNPLGRTTRRAVGELMKSIGESGFDPFRPLLIANDGKTIGDGHRRWTAAKFLELGRVPAIFTDKTAQQLWHGNFGSRSISAHDWMAAHILGDIPIGPTKTARQVDQLQTIMGPEGMVYLIDRAISPDIYRTAWAIGAYTRSKGTPVSNGFLRKTVYWLIKHQMIHKATRAVWGPADQRVPAKLLRQAIDQDHPLRFAWEIGE